MVHDKNSVNVSKEHHGVPSIESQATPELDANETTVWDIIQAGSIGCGNCEVYRKVDGSGEVQKCSNCGDDEYNLCDYADGPAAIEGA